MLGLRKTTVKSFGTFYRGSQNSNFNAEIFNTVLHGKPELMATLITSAMCYDKDDDDDDDGSVLMNDKMIVLLLSLSIW